MTVVTRGRLTVLLASALLLPACKLGKVKVPEGAEREWSAMDHGERLGHMTTHVEPRMKQVFQTFDAERFADFGCKTCHGAGADDGSYAMPNPDLPHLEEKGFFKKARKEHPDVVKFMWKEVESNVADALGVTYGPAGQIACHACHIVDDHEG